MTTKTNEGATPRRSAVPASQSATETASELGLNVDMLDVDRLREWARLIETFGSDISHWAAAPFVVTKLRDIADRLDREVREVGQLREVNRVLYDALSLAECVYRKNVVVVGEPSSVLDAMQAAIAKAEGKP